MKIKILSSPHFQISQWAGGSSTQLYIFPITSSYSARDFDLRISTARVEVEESSFTSLPGVKRKLMVIEGEINITHKGQYNRNLKPLEVETFSGDWITTAKGTCIDFNVMTRGSVQSELYSVKMGAQSNYTLSPKRRSKNLFLYSTSGSIEVQLMKVNYALEKGSLMLIENPDSTAIMIHSVKALNLIVVEIH